MYNIGKVITGIIIFLLFVAFPFYYNIGKVIAIPDPSLDTPVINELVEKKCVEPREFMRVNHMTMLNDWRDLAIREGRRAYINTEGKLFEISLQNTCMYCHSNKERFCTECHVFVAVQPYCWTCHIAPEEGGL